MMIYYFTPYDTSGLIGKAYNDCCAIVPHDDDWIALMDGDIMFVSNTYGKQVEEVVRQYGNQYDALTCFATRIGGPAQRYLGMIDDEKDLTRLKIKVLEAERREWGKVSPVHEVISGHFLLFKKSLWNEFPFALRCDSGTILGIDNEWSNRLLIAGKRIGIMRGLVAVHYYRLAEGRKYKEHLKVT